MEEKQNQFKLSLWHQKLENPVLAPRGTSYAGQVQSDVSEDVRGTSYSRPSIQERGLELNDTLMTDSMALIAAQYQNAAKPTSLFVNPESRYKPQKIYELLKSNETLPRGFRKGIKLMAESEAIEFPQALPLAQPKNYLKDILSIQDNWEVTTARLVVELNALGGRIGARFEEHLQDGSTAAEKAEQYGYPFPIIEKGKIKEVVLKRTEFDKTFRNDDPELIVAKTIPNKKMAIDNPGYTTTVPGEKPYEIAELKSKRGLIILATEIVVRKGGTESLPLAIPEEIISKKLLHELSSHAGLFSQGKPAAHGTLYSDLNASEAESGQVSEKARLEIEAFFNELNKRENHIARQR